MNARDLLPKLETLPPEKLAEVEDFVDFLQERVRRQPRDEASIRARLSRIADEMTANTFAGDPPRFTRDELHERR